MNSMRLPPTSSGVDPTLAQPPIPRADGSADAAREFEAVLLGMLVQEMRESLPGDGLFGKTPGSDVLEGLFDRLMGESLAAGEGIGLRRALSPSLPVRSESNRGIAPPTSSSEVDSIRP